MTKEGMEDPIQGVLAHSGGMLDDEDIQNEVKKLILHSLKHANHVMKTGSPDARAGIMRTMLPAVARTIRSQQDNDELDQLRQAMQSMMAQVAGAPSPPPQAAT